MRKSLVYLIVGGLLFGACKPDDSEQPSGLTGEENEELSGGQATIFDISPNAFSFQAPGVNGQDELLFFVGNSYFNQNWVAAPASTKARDGLGPLLNARACSSCHFKDGRGSAPETFKSEQFNNGYLVRLSVPGEDENGGPIGDPIYGGQLQDQSISSVTSEGSLSILYDEITGQYADGTPYTLRQPTIQFDNLAYGEMHSNIMTSARVAPQMIGLGLLEAISESDILTHADENDTDEDGISGRANYVWDKVNSQTSMGRFGWKANQPNLLQQTAGAFLGDMGITTYLFPDENCINFDCDTIPNGGDVEIDEDDLNKVVLYSSTLAVPARRNWNDQEVLEGKEIFNDLNCSACHVPKFTTSAHEKFEALSHQIIRPYTDLLLHDMGDSLSDGRPDYLATGNEWRTPPLWGIGLFQTVNGHTQYLHDGRARNLEEAILWHGGEAQNAKNEFKKLDKVDRDKLIKFLESL